jgi:hypothetical protein
VRPSGRLALGVTCVVVSLCSTSAFAFLLTRTVQTSQLAQQATVICTAKVLTARAQWRDDDLGSHIHTQVRVWIDQWIKGRTPSRLMSFEVLGGTVDGVTETVSHTPVFTPGESAVLLLGGSPLQVVGGPEGKIPIAAGRVWWDGRPVLIGEIGSSLTRGETSDPCDPTGSSAAATPVPRPKCQITDIVPAVASAGTATEVNIIGTGFGEKQASGAVEFFYRAVRTGSDRTTSKIKAPIVSWSDTRIVCEVPIGTIDDYDASAGSGPVTVLSDNRDASNEFPFKVTFGHDPTTWARNQAVIRYYVNENTADCSGEGAAVQAAAELWNRTLASVQLAYSGAHSNTRSSRNGHNEVLWGTLPSDSSYSRAIAVAFTWTDRSSRTECDIVLNDPNYSWSASGEPKASQMDVMAVTAHEFGHWLNLRDLYGDAGDHEYDSAKMMYGYGYPGQVKRAIHPDDVAGIHYAYPPSVPPAAPEALNREIDPDTGNARITWTASPQASSYELQRTADGGARWLSIYRGPHTYWLEAGLESGLYQYRARAGNLAGVSGWQTDDWTYGVPAPEPVL